MLLAKDSAITISQYPHNLGLSVRCIKDEEVRAFDRADYVTSVNWEGREQLLNTTLPVIRINTPDERSISKKWMKQDLDHGYAKISIENAGVYDLASTNIDIQGFGQSAWNFPKKPYKIDVSSPLDILGMGEHKNWALLANHNDKSLLRTQLGFNLGRIFDQVGWTPGAQFVELVLNGSYIGVYQMVEDISLGKNRIDLDSTAGDFLVEVDNRLLGQHTYTSTKNVKFSFAEPQKISAAKLVQYQANLQKIEDVLYSKNFADSATGYRQYVDVNSFVDWYIANEFVKNNDANFFAYVFLHYRSQEDKIYAGPLWDFDISAGNINYNNNDLVEGLHVAKGRWINQMLKDPYFSNLVKQRWEQNKNALWQAVQNLRQQGEDMALVANNNFTRWPILGVELWPNRIWPETYAEEVEELVQWLEARYHWLDGQF
ncbi:MAG: hypothetical protein GX801_00045 [Fibrobacter sp.]|nr:hypothetical protein [Fibrobacter sp.]